MKLLTAAAAIFFWLQGPVCALKGGEPAGSVAHAHVHDSAGDVPHHHGEPDPSQPSDSNAGEDHCDVVASAVSTSAPAWLTPAAVPIAAFQAEPDLAPPADPGLHRAPPVLSDPVFLRHSVLRL